MNLKRIIKCHFPSLTGLQTNEIWCREILRKRCAFYRRNFLRLQASRWQPIATQGRASHLRVSASTNANDAFMHEAERRARRFYALPRGRLLARARPPNLRSFLGYVFVTLTSWVLQVFPSFCMLHISKREGENIFINPFNPSISISNLDYDVTYAWVLSVSNVSRCFITDTIESINALICW